MSSLYFFYVNPTKCVSIAPDLAFSLLMRFYNFVCIVPVLFALNLLSGSLSSANAVFPHFQVFMLEKFSGVEQYFYSMQSSY